MVTTEKINELLHRYHVTYRHPTLRPLVLSEIYSLHPETIDAAKSLQWPAIWPGCGDPGVYLILDAEMNLLYVGKASMSHNLAGRLSKYFQYAKDDSRRCHVLHVWSATPTFVLTIAVDADKEFEAPAL